MENVLDSVNWSTVYGFLSFTSGVVALSVTVYLSPYLKNIRARILALLMLAVSVWSLAYGMEFLTPNLYTKLQWVKVEYFGAVWIGMLVLCFVLTISGYQWHLKKRWLLLLSFVPVSTFTLALTNNHHHLMWKMAWLELGGKAPVLAYHRGIAFWVFVVYSYFLLFTATIVLIRMLVSSRDLEKKQLTTLLVGISFPWLSNILYLFGVEIYQYIDLTPASFTISGVAFLLGLIRYQMLNLISLAHETILESMGDPVISLDNEDRILDINTAGQSMFRMDNVMSAHQKLSDLAPELHDKLMHIQREAAVEIETEITLQNEKKHLNLKISPLRNKKKRLLGRLIILKDITSRKKTEAALRESESVHRIILETSPNPIVFYNSEGEVTYLNPAFTRIFGWTLSELEGKQIDFVPQEEAEKTFKAIQETLDRPGGNINFVTRRLTKSGEILDVSINAAPNRSQNGNLSNMVVNFTDITKIKTAEQELIKAKNYIRNILNSMPSILIGLDENGKITHWNSEAQRLTGISNSSAEGRKLESIFPQISAQMHHVKTATHDHEIKKENRVSLVINDKMIITDITIYPILTHHDNGVVIRIDDISERVRLEEMMIQSEKMLSVGGLAAGMAHEINNPLAGIIQNIQVMQNRLTRNLPANLETAEKIGIDFIHLKSYLEKRKIISMMELVKDSAQRAAQIVSNMLSFSRKSGHRKTPHFLHRIMEDTIKLVENDYSLRKQYDFRNIEIRKEYSDNLPSVLCEKNEIQQVFLNILKNGAEAMGEAGIQSPRFIVKAFRQDQYVVFEIEDNGPGIDPKTRKRIFEPFFTTKDVGIGTGLGLSVSYFIITENHGGELSVDSTLGKGTTFRLKIPAKDAL